MAHKKLNKTEKNMMIIFVVLSFIAIIAAVLIKIYAPKPVDPSTIPKPIPDSVKTALEEMAPSDERIQYIYDNIEQYSAEILTYFVTRNEYKPVIDFVYDYPIKHELNKKAILTEEELSSDLPLFMQYDERWGYKYLGGGDGGELIAQTGCLCCCLSMVYTGIEHNDQLTPDAVSVVLMGNDMLGISGTKKKAVKWFCDNYGYNCVEYSYDENVHTDKQLVIDSLNAGKYVIVTLKPGEYTKVGHAIVIREYKDGKFYLNDPDNETRNNQPSSFEDFANDVDSLWVISDNN